MAAKPSKAEDDVAGARQAFLAFVADMHAWERPAHAALTGFFSSPDGPKTQEALDALRARVREQLRAVFDAHGVAGDKNRQRLENLTTGDPADYNPATVTIVKEEPSAGGVRIYADKADGLRDSWRFTLSRLDGRWVLAKKEVLRATGRWAGIAF
jgi:hypothetical protein